jgi:hypothetical protein
MVGTAHNNPIEIRPNPQIIMDSGEFIPNDSVLLQEWRLTSTTRPELEQYLTPFPNDYALFLEFNSDGTLSVSSRDFSKNPDTGLYTYTLIDSNVLTWELDSQDSLIFSSIEDDSIFGGVFDAIVSLHTNSGGTHINLTLSRDGETYVFRGTNIICVHCS